MVQARKGANQNRENENGVAENQMKKDEVVNVGLVMGNNSLERIL